MTQPKTNKKTLLTSALSLLLCCTMLIGTTWAWFTDSVTSAGNKIQSGTLKVDLLVKGGNTGVGLDDDYESVKTGTLANQPIFDYELWEPGYTLVTYAKVVNEGSLALKYTLKFVSESDIAAAKLAEAIDVYYASSEVTGIGTRADFNSAVENNRIKKLDTLKNVFAGGGALTVNGNLDPKGESNDQDYATIVLKMKEEAGNEYQNQTIPAFDIQLLATQWTYENDSFDNKYDENAEYPVLPVKFSVGNKNYEGSKELAVSVKNYVDKATNAIPANTAFNLNATSPYDLVAIGNMIKDGVIAYNNGEVQRTIEIAEDIDMSGVDFESIGVMRMTINGDNHTIKNLKAPLFAYAGDCAVNNLTVENVTISGNQAGTFAQNAEGFRLTNCTLSGNVNVSYKNIKDETWRAIGALVGWNNGVTFTNVNIADNTVITMDATGITDGHAAPENLTYDTYVGTGTYTGVTVVGNVTVNYTHP